MLHRNCNKSRKWSWIVNIYISRFSDNCLISFFFLFFVNYLDHGDTRWKRKHDQHRFTHVNDTFRNMPFALDICLLYPWATLAERERENILQRVKTNFILFDWRRKIIRVVKKKKRYFFIVTKFRGIRCRRKRKNYYSL